MTRTYYEFGGTIGDMSVIMDLGRCIFSTDFTKEGIAQNEISIY
jgi:hypothetical protein